LRQLPDLYAGVSRARLLRDTFAAAEPLDRDASNQWWATPDALVCFAPVGDRRGRDAAESFFTDARHFEWVSPGGPEDGPADFPGIPREIRARENGGRRLLLFVHSRPAPDDLTFIGEMEPAYTYGCRGKIQSARFELRSTVPSVVLERLGLLGVDAAFPAALDRDLRSLLARPLEHRLATLRQLIEHWHGPLSPGDAYGPGELEGVEAPEPLVWWYRTGGKRSGVFDFQNRVLRPRDLYLREGKLVFYVENQVVWEMATLPVGSDPPVWSRENDHRAHWIEEPAPLSVALVQACILEAVMQSMYGAQVAWAQQEVVDLLAEHLPELPYGGLHFSTLPTRFFVGGGALAVVMPNPGPDEEMGFTIMLAAKTEHPLQFLRKTDTSQWELSAF
jgi:hypothetical protein